jgi:hypothetical protein
MMSFKSSIKDVASSSSSLCLKCIDKTCLRPSIWFQDCTQPILQISSVTCPKNL